MIRSIFFGGFAMLAAALCMSAPAVATDYSPAVFTLSLSDFDYDVPAVFKVEAVVVRINSIAGRSTNSHAVQYTSYNQPGSKHRNAVDAYFRIDPHIRTA